MGISSAAARFAQHLCGGNQPVTYPRSPLKLHGPQAAVKLTARALDDRSEIGVSEREVHALCALIHDEIYAERVYFRSGLTRRKLNWVERRDFNFWQNDCRPTEDKCYFGFFADDNLVGMLHAKKYYLRNWEIWIGRENSKKAYINGLYIHPNYRCKGGVYMLKRAAEQWCRENNIETVFCFITPTSLTSTAFCKRFGGVRKGRAIAGPLLHPVIANLFRLDLSKSLPPSRQPAATHLASVAEHNHG
jgi:hypothetical protein